jgi:hypothetical protein
MPIKTLEYEENLPKHYDKDKFVLSGLRYEAILNCLDKEKRHKTEEGAKFKHWVYNIFYVVLDSYLTNIYSIFVCFSFKKL